MPTSKRATETVWRMMDKCILIFQPIFCETMRSTAVWMRKNDFIWREREGKLGCGPRNTEEVCPVNTVIVMSYLITVWTGSKEGSIRERQRRDLKTNTMLLKVEKRGRRQFDWGLRWMDDLITGWMTGRRKQGINDEVWGQINIYI